MRAEPSSPMPYTTNQEERNQTDEWTALRPARPIIQPAIVRTVLRLPRGGSRTRRFRRTRHRNRMRRRNRDLLEILALVAVGLALAAWCALHGFGAYS